jgi:voltage-gated potassium channel Kch
MTNPRDQWHHLALLISILLLFALGPVVEVLPRGSVIMNLLGVLVLVAGSNALRPRRGLFVAALIISAVSVIGTSLVQMTQWEWAAVFSFSCFVVLIVYFSVTILAYVLRNTRVTTDKIFAAVCVYLLIGLAWTFAFALVDALNPHAFLALSAAGHEKYVIRLLELRYFSFMTLTTVGYGDIVPYSTAARTLAALEAIVGQIYLTVLVARLVGLHIVGAQSSSTDKD